MARQIIILENQHPTRTGGDSISYRFAFWLSVPAARQTFYANASATSAVKDATAGELAAIQNGSITEFVDRFEVPSGTTLAQIQAGLVSQYNAKQAAVNNYNPWDHYATNWDGASWNTVTVA